jgi:hypothetical protein
LIRTLRVETDRLLVGRLAPLSPQVLEERVGKTLRRLDRLVRQAEKAGREIRSGTMALTRAAGTARSALRVTGKNLDPTWGRMESSLIAAVAVEKNIEEALRSMDKLFAPLRDSTGAIGRHFYDRKAYDEMLSALGLLQQALRTLKKEGLEDAIQFRRNIHLFGGKSR